MRRRDADEAAHHKLAARATYAALAPLLCGREAQAVYVDFLAEMDAIIAPPPEEFPVNSSAPFPATAAASSAATAAAELAAFARIAARAGPCGMARS